MAKGARTRRVTLTHALSLYVYTCIRIPPKVSALSLRGLAQCDLTAARAGVCGDGVCGYDETGAQCPADCTGQKVLQSPCPNIFTV
jgi:hypothetical protein